MKRKSGKDCEKMGKTHWGENGGGMLLTFNFDDGGRLGDFNVIGYIDVCFFQQPVHVSYQF